MGNETYHFKVGNFECVALSDGTHTYAPPIFPPPPTFLFIDAPKERLAQKLKEHNLQRRQWAEWVSPYVCLLIKAGKHIVLVDTGAGGLGPNTGHLLQNLRSENIPAESIDTVILTHGHPDHIGGNTNDEGKLTFSNARFVMWKEEWDFWNSEQALKLDEHSRDVLLAIARKNLLPLRSQLETVDLETEIMHGIRAIAAPGHTPGHMALTISSKNEKLLVSSDAFLHPIHVEQPEWHAMVDFAPQQVTSTRHRLFALAAASKVLVLAFHFTFPGLGYIVPKGKQWRWQPLLEGSNNRNREPRC